MCYKKMGFYFDIVFHSISIQSFSSAEPDERPTIGDVVVFILHLYFELHPPAQPFAKPFVSLSEMNLC